MFKSKKTRFVSVFASLILFFGVLILAVGSTGAYFSDTHPGTITGTIGSIRITPSGGTGNTGTAMNFTNLLPGVPQTVTIGYKNTGANNEDVYIIFNNATALSALNNLGTYGAVTLSANGTTLFQSANLDDNSTSCGAFKSTLPSCWPLLSQYKVASNVPPGATGSISFSFSYASKLKGQASAGTITSWNVYPVPGQFVTNSSDGTGSGLPYQIAATQVGITPGM